jgi:hypothetical protein
MEIDVIETLIELRRSYGLTPGHIREVGQPLMDALGTSDANVAHKLVADAIEHLGRTRHALVLTASYGLDMEDAVTSLATRQSRMAQSLGISLDTVKRDERRAINELHRLLFPGGARMSLSSRVDHQASRYVNSIEYIDLDAHSGQAQFSIVANNHRHNNKEFHIPNTPADDEWRDEHFLAATLGLRKHVTKLLACLAGWSVDSLMLVRPDVSNKSIIQRIDSAQDVAQPDWNSVSALLHLRRWQLFRGVDDGFVDLYINPSAGHPWGPYIEEVFDEARASQLVGMRDQILHLVTAIVREVLQEPTCTLAYSGSVQWEKENTPVTGGDSYHFRLVIIENT